MTVRRGISQLELLIILGVTAVIVAIFIPVAGHLRLKRSQITCKSNLQQISRSLESYLEDQNHRMPIILAGRSSLGDPGPTIDMVLKSYVDDMSIFHCPEDEELHAKSGCSYLWNSTCNGLYRGDLTLENSSREETRTLLISHKRQIHSSSEFSLYAVRDQNKNVAFQIMKDDE